MEINNGYGRTFKFDFSINRVESGALAGFTLVAQKQREAEFFCKTFPEALYLERGGIGLLENGLRIFNEICPFQPADFCLPLNKETIKEFSEFYGSGGKFQIAPCDKGIGFVVIHAK